MRVGQQLKKFRYVALAEGSLLDKGAIIGRMSPVLALKSKMPTGILSLQSKKILF